MSYLKDREIWLSNVPTGNPPAGYFWKFIQNGKVVVRDSSGNDQMMIATNGSQAITGSLIVTGGITGTISSASYVQYSNVANKPTLVSGSGQISFNGITNKPTLVSGSSQVTFLGLSSIPSGIVSGSSQVTYSGLTGIPSGIVSGSAQVAQFGYATTGANGFNGSQSITGSLTVTGQVIAQTLNVQQVTSSIVYSSGSNVFGNNTVNNHRFTGSVNITGSLSVNGALSGTSATFSGNVTSDDLILTAGTLFGTGNTGFSNRSSDTTLYLQMPATGFNITDNALNTRFILSSAGAITSQTTGNNGIIKIGGSTYYSQLETNSTLGGLKIKSVWGAANSGIIQFINGTSENIRMHIADNGNIGIGNTEALELLHLKDPNKNPSIRIDHAGGGSTFMKFQQFSGWNASMTFTSAFNYMGIDVTIPLVLNQNGSNVGIGTTSPAHQLTLNKASNPQIAFTTGDVLKAAITHITSDNSLRIYNIDGDKITITSGGNVGIGISTGISSKLTVSSSTKGIGVNESNIQIESNESLAANIGGSLGFGATSDYGIVTLAKIGGYRENATGNSVSSYLSFETRSGSGANTERMRITSGGNIGIGTTSPDEPLHIVKSSATTNTYVEALHLEGKTTGTVANGFGPSIGFWGSMTGQNNVELARIAALNTNVAGANGALVFYTRPNAAIQERMRINSGGFLKVSNDGTYNDASGVYHEISASTNDSDLLFARHKGSSPYGLDLQFSAASPNNTTNWFFYATDTTNAKFIIYSNGNAVNRNGSYGAISDIKLKENIEDATPKLDDLMKVKVRNYNLIGDEKKQIGVIAQELEEIFPAMVDESTDFEEVEVPQLDTEGNEILNEEGQVVTIKERVSKGTSTKSVKYSVFVPMLVKALQEQQTLIESLKSRIEILEQ